MTVLRLTALHEQVQRGAQRRYGAAQGKPSVLEARVSDLHNDTCPSSSRLPEAHHAVDRLPAAISAFMHHQLDKYPRAKNLSIVGTSVRSPITLVIMILTGITLAITRRLRPVLLSTASDTPCAM